MNIYVVSFIYVNAYRKYNLLFDAENTPKLVAIKKGNYLEQCSALISDVRKLIVPILVEFIFVEKLFLNGFLNM